MDQSTTFFGIKCDYFGRVILDDFVHVLQNNYQDSIKSGNIIKLFDDCDDLDTYLNSYVVPRKYYYF